MKKLIHWKALTKTHPEFLLFDVAVLIRHLSLIFHVPITRHQVLNLRKNGVCRLVQPSVVLAVDNRAGILFSWIFSRLFEARVFSPIAKRFADCREHEKCVIVTWETERRETTVEHTGYVQLRQQFFVRQYIAATEIVGCAVGKKFRRVCLMESWSKGRETHYSEGEQLGEGTEETELGLPPVSVQMSTEIVPIPESARRTYVWAESFTMGAVSITAGSIVNEIVFRVEQRTESKTVTEYINKKVEGWETVEGRVRKALYRVHARMYNSIPLRRYGTGMSSLRGLLAPTFNPKDVEQSLCEKLFLTCRGVDADDALGTIVKRIARAKGKAKDKALEELSFLLIRAGQNSYVGMLRKELRKVYSYDNRIDFIEDSSGFYKPVNLLPYEQAE